MEASVILTDPRERFVRPPFKKQEKIAIPGKTSEMSPRPDHGEESYKGSGKLAGLTVVITGGDSGIGRATAIACAREGANVVIHYLIEDEDAKSTCAAVREAGVQGIALRGDLREELECEKLIASAYEEFGPVDVLINNAAYQEMHDELEEFSTKFFDRVMKTNLYAPFWLSRAVLSQMPAGGSIINTVSIQGYQPAAHLLPYATSKSALIGMTKALAKLAIKNGVRVNAVAPGPVWTPLIPSTSEDVENFGANTLFGRPAQPAELAPLFVWLASAEASYVTGEVFGATGGNMPV